jgi:hypothetical protein
MKALKVGVNALLGGLFFAALLALLVYDLNLMVPVRASVAARLGLFLFLTYGLAAALGLAIVFFLLQFFSGRTFRVPVVSPSFCLLAFAALTIVFLVVLRENVRYFGSFFDAGVRAGFRAQAFALGAPAALGIVFFAASRGGARPLVSLGFAGLVLGAAGAWLVRADVRPPALPAPAASISARALTKRATVIVLEGLSFDFLFPLMTEGKLPNFSWLAENGAWSRLDSLRPSEISVLDTSAATGKLPYRHRKFSPVKYALPWGVGDFEVMPRFILFRQLTRLGLIEIQSNDAPPRARSLAEIAAANDATIVGVDDAPDGCGETPDAKAGKALQEVLPDGSSGLDPRLDIVKKAFFCDRAADEAFAAARASGSPGLARLALGGLNAVQTSFYKYRVPGAFGAIDQAAINRYGEIIDKYYAFYDRLVGRYLAARKDDEILVVYSSFGVEPMPFWMRLVEWLLANSELSGTHEGAPQGAVFFAGPGVAKGHNVEGVRLIDLAPTLLYFLGLPVGKDMDGIVRSALFQPEFTAENPILYITSYEDVQIAPRR